ncbi:MAG: hypothetical protein VKL39_07815, partial [Leptolyngbyaceae bacterium]|nr:hypothetical protein [Leptolyngbyaceae bacterium]
SDIPLTTLAMERKLKSLEAELERILQVVLHASEPQVRCRTTPNAMYVLIQHTRDAESASSTIYQALASFFQQKKSICEQLFEQPKDDTTPSVASYRPIFVGLYHKGCSSAYEKRKMQFKKAEPVPLVESAVTESAVTESAVTEIAVSAAPQASDHSSASESSLSGLALSSPARSSPTLSSSGLLSDKSSQESLPVTCTEESTDERNLAQRNLSDTITTRLFSNAQSLQSLMQQVSSVGVLSTIQQQFNDRWGIIRVTTASVAIALLSTGAYAVTRPCVIGACPLLDTAQAFNQESQDLLDAATTDTVTVAYEKLLEANYQLGKIPFWSDYYDQAQLLISQYQQEADLISKIVSAQREAQQAIVLAQEPPYPLETWEEIRNQWEMAIAQLNSIPDNTKVTELARLKRAEYQTYLATVNQHIQREQEAQAKIAAAREAAQIAEERESTADSPESWNLVHVTWQVVMQRLSGIPNDTMAYAEAQHLNVIYEARLMDSKDRNRREQLSRDAYAQATALADQAVQLEQNGSLTQAMVAWQNALSNIQQIPEGTLYYEQAQTLLSSYTEELDRTEQTLARLASLEDFRARLNQACATYSSLCSYSLGNDEIDVFIEASYSEEIRQLVRAGMPAFQREEPRSENVAERSKLIAFLQTLTEIGSDSGMPLVLYDQDRELIATYDPERGGYHQASMAISQMN